MCKRGNPFQRSNRLLLANADQVIGDAVNEMAEYYGLAEPSAPALQIVRSEPKIGRNDPCPVVRARNSETWYLLSHGELPNLNGTTH